MALAVNLADGGPAGLATASGGAHRGLWIVFLGEAAAAVALASVGVGCLGGELVLFQVARAASSLSIAHKRAGRDSGSPAGDSGGGRMY